MATYTKIVDPNNGAGTDYTSLSAWEAGEQGLYSSGDIAIADCRRTGSLKDTNAVKIAGWTAGVIPKIIANSAYRHQGKWADQRSGSDTNYIYNLIWSTGYRDQIIDASVDGCEIVGLEIEDANNSYSRSLMVISSATNCKIYNNIINHTGSAAPIGIEDASGADRISYIYNNIILNCTGDYGIRISDYKSSAGSGAAYIYNNTVYNANYGIDLGYATSNGKATKVIRNNVSLNCSSACFAHIYDSAANNNISSDATAPGTTVAINQTSYTDYFVDPANGDFHLKASSQSLFGIASANLYSTFTTDIDGDTRSNSDQFGIGADYYVSASGAVIPVFMNQYRQRWS